MASTSIPVLAHFLKAREAHNEQLRASWVLASPGHEWGVHGRGGFVGMSPLLATWLYTGVRCARMVRHTGAMHLRVSNVWSRGLAMDEHRKQRERKKRPHRHGANVPLQPCFTSNRPPESTDGVILICRLDWDEKSFCDLDLDDRKKNI